MRTIKISPWILALGCAFLIVYIVWSIFIVNKYFQQRYVVERQNAQIKNLVDNITEIKKEIHKAKQRIALLEEKPVLKKGTISTGAKRQTKQEDAQKKPTSPKKIARNKADDEKKSEAAKNIPKKPETKPSEPSPVASETRPLVGVKKPVMEIADDRVKIRFKLVNLVQGKEPLRGYVHIILMDNKHTPPKIWSARGIQLENGMPVNYKDGQLFSIKRFRVIHGSSPLDSGLGVPTSMRVVVFDKAGTMIFNQEFKLENTASTSPQETTCSPKGTVFG